MKNALVDRNNKVINIIEYKDGDNIALPNGIALIKVNDWIEINDMVDKPIPVAKPIETNAQRKKNRDELLSKDLSLKAAYKIELRSNPSLTFSDYLDQLEADII